VIMPAVLSGNHQRDAPWRAFSSSLHCHADHSQ